MITENNIEQSVITAIKADGMFAGFSFENTLMALNPMTYDFSNARGGAVLVTCTNTDYSGKPLARSFLNARYSVTVSLGVAGLRNNEKLWEYKQAIIQAVGNQQLIPELSMFKPISDAPFYPESQDGVFWVRIDFETVNYTGL